MRKPVDGITKKEKEIFEFPTKKLTVIRNIGHHIAKLLKPKPKKTFRLGPNLQAGSPMIAEEFRKELKKIGFKESKR